MGSAVGGIMITKGFSLALWPTRASQLGSRGGDGHNQLSLSRCKQPSGSHQLSPATGCRRASRMISINYQPTGSCCNDDMHGPENFYRAIYSQGVGRSDRMATLGKFLH